MHVWLPGEFGGFTTPGYLWRFFANPVIAELNITGVRAVTAVNHGRYKTVAIYLILGEKRGEFKEQS